MNGEVTPALLMIMTFLMLYTDCPVHSHTCPPDNISNFGLMYPHDTCLSVGYWHAFWLNYMYTCNLTKMHAISQWTDIILKFVKGTYLVSCLNHRSYLE